MQKAKSLDDFTNAEIISLDFETVSLTDKTVELFSMATVKGDWRNEDDIVAGAFMPDQMPKLLEFLKGRRVVFHNAKFDCLVLLEQGFNIWEFDPEDTMLMCHLLDENQSVSLKIRASTDLGMEMVEWNQEQAEAFRNGTSRDEYMEYAVRDAVATIRLFHGYRAEIKKQDLVTAYKIEMKSCIPITYMEYNGIGFDDQKAKELEILALGQKRHFEDEIFISAGYAFSPSKSRELGVYLYDDLGIPYKPEYSRGMKTNARSVSKKVLEEVRYALDNGQNEELLQKLDNILGWKTMNKLVTSFFKKQREFAGIYGDGKVHANYNQATIVTGRIGVTNPNLNQLPANPIIKDKPDTNIRCMYVPSEGHKFVGADYSQIELRMMAHMSNDYNMIKAYHDGIDIHQMLADATGISRRDAKVANFGKQYGMGPYSFAKVTHMRRPDAIKFYEDFDRQFPGQAELKKAIINMVLDRGYIRMVGGRKRRLNQSVDEKGIERMFTSSLIQGSSAIVLKLAMIKLFERYKNKEVKLVLTVHDEVLLECPDGMETQVAAEVKADMETAIKLRVPLEVEPKVGNNFGEVK